MTGELEWQPEWRWSHIHPAWVRWLPCAIASLRIAPADADAFPRTWWDQPELSMPWDEPVWCDPGSREEWLAGAKPGESDEEAEEHYDKIIAARTVRIENFTRLCQRAGVPVPLTLRELLDCLIAMGLMETFPGEDGQAWVVSNLAGNPLDMLSFTVAEAAEEAQTQQGERGVMAGIGLRRAAESAGPAAATDRVRVTLRELGDLSDLAPLVMRHALAVTLEAESWITVEAGVELASVGLDQPFTVFADHADLATVFEMDELQPPEHLI